MFGGVQPMFMSSMTLYQNGQYPLYGNPEQNWQWWEAAYTACTQELHGEILKGNATVAYAEAVCAFDANSPGSYTGVQFMISDVAQANAYVIAQFAAIGTGPRPYLQDVTSAVQGAIDSGQFKVFSFRSFGNTIAGVLLFEAKIDVYWK